MNNFPAFLLPLLILLVPGCSKPESDLKRGLVYCSEANPTLFNPQRVSSSSTLDASAKTLYNQLLGFDNDSGQLKPELATEWQTLDEGRRYRFTLRRGVEFHSSDNFTPSRNFNADDVLFSFQRLIDASHPYHQVGDGQYPFFQSIELADNLVAIEKRSEYQIDFVLKQPDATFLTNLATDFAVILSAEYGEQLLAQQQTHRIDLDPIGTGPYRLGDYKKNQFIRFLKHPHYFDKPALSEQLIFDITPNATGRMIKLIGGDCDVAALPQQGQQNLVQDHQDLKLERQPGFNVAYWAFNTQKPPFDDLQVRRALAMAINRDKILKAVYHEEAIAASGLLPPSSWAFQRRGATLPHNPQLAKAMLEHAGVSGLTLDIWAPTLSRSYNPNAIKTAELIQQDLAQIGVKVNIVSYDWNLFNQKLRQAEHDSVLLGWNADNYDPDNFFTPLLSCNGMLSGTNHSRWCASNFDELLTQARRTGDQGQRRLQYQQLESYLQQQVPLLPLAHATRSLGKDQRLKGPILTAVGGIDFSQVEASN